MVIFQCCIDPKVRCCGKYGDIAIFIPIFLDPVAVAVAVAREECLSGLSKPALISGHQCPHNIVLNFRFLCYPYLDLIQLSSPQELSSCLPNFSEEKNEQRKARVFQLLPLTAFRDN